MDNTPAGFAGAQQTKDAASRQHSRSRPRGRGLTGKMQPKIGSIVSSMVSEPSEPIRKLLESNESDMIPFQALDPLGERPMWKSEHRRAADRTDLRYPSDLTNAEWVIVEPITFHRLAQQNRPPT
jgi:hypothetical protein